jgi:hypothetical protein
MAGARSRRPNYASGVVIASGPDARETFALICAATVLTGVVAGVALGWIRGGPVVRGRWMRHAHHGIADEDNTKPRRFVRFALLSIVAAAGAVFAGAMLRPAWYAALACYDLVLLGIWWMAVAIYGFRQHLSQ